LVSRTQEYEFTIEKRDPKNPALLKQVTVKVTEVTIETYTDDGKLVKTTTQATAKAENTQQANIRLSDAQLRTVETVTSNIVAGAANRGVNREVALSLGAKETFLGSDPRPGARDFQQPSINPLQLSMGRANTDLTHNVDGGLDVYKERSNGQTEEAGIRRYGPAPGHLGSSTYVAEVTAHLSNIRGNIAGTIRQTSKPTVKYVY
jgi:hypothetical protein